jgi:hypothetical protein
MKAQAQVCRACFGFVFTVLTFSVILLGAAGLQAPRVNEDALALKEFTDAVQEYVRLHKHLAGSLTPNKRTVDPAKIKAYQDSLARKIQEARAGAKQGDIFTPASALRFRRLIKNHFQGPHGAQSKETIRQGEPVKVVLRVNDSYPKGVPLTTMPATLLQNLPQLPEEVKYGIVNRDLILRDARAHLVVDFIRDVLP